MNTAELSALVQIASASIPDQPAASEGNELAWAQRHVAKLRRIALDALGADGAKAASRAAQIEVALKELLADIDDMTDEQLSMFSAATLSRARIAVGA